MDFRNYCAESFNSSYFKYHCLRSNKYAPACRHNKVFNLEQKVVELLNMKAAGCASLLWGKWNFVLDICVKKGTKILRPNVDLGRLNGFLVYCDFFLLSWLGKRTFNILFQKRNWFSEISTHKCDWKNGNNNIIINR